MQTQPLDISRGRWRAALLCLLLPLFGCNPIFETSADVQARQALLDLMRIQEEFYKENKRYANNFAEIEKYNLQYHKGIVYIEFESVDEKQYRIVSLPAESTTARVFAHDTAKGGFYEMDDDEVSKYVLGALKHIKKAQMEKNVSDGMAAFLIALLVAFGCKSVFGAERAPGYGVTYAAFFLSLYPLAWTVGFLNHMSKKTAVSGLLQSGLYSSIVTAVFCLAIGGISAARYAKERGPTALVGLIFAMVAASLFSLVMLSQQYMLFFRA